SRVESSPYEFLERSLQRHCGLDSRVAECVRFQTDHYYCDRGSAWSRRAVRDAAAPPRTAWLKPRLIATSDTSGQLRSTTPLRNRRSITAPRHALFRPARQRSRFSPHLPSPRSLGRGLSRTPAAPHQEPFGTA